MKNNNKKFIILDFGSSKIRLSVFDKHSKNNFSKSELVKYENNFFSHFTQTLKIIKNAEKKISLHIEDIVLTLDHQKTITIDVSIFKNLDEKISFDKAYEIITLELRYLINNNYPNYEIIHIIFDKCFLDEKKELQKFPTNFIKVHKLKVSFKIICFPKEHINTLKNNFNKINLNVISIYSTSYVKSLSHLNNLNLKSGSFLDIGFNRSTLILFKNSKLELYKTIPIGSLHISKDVSNILKITLEEAEKIKNSFNKTETEFSYDHDQEDNFISAKEILNKNISVNLLKKVILYRVQEIVDLAFENSKNKSNNFQDDELFLIGEGSKLFNNNSFYLNDKFEFKKINFLEESDIEICKFGLDYFMKNNEISKNILKKHGIFEKFFNFFG